MHGGPTGWTGKGPRAVRNFLDRILQSQNAGLHRGGAWQDQNSSPVTPPVGLRNDRIHPLIGRQEDIMNAMTEATQRHRSCRRGLPLDFVRRRPHLS